MFQLAVTAKVNSPSLVGDMAGNNLKSRRNCRKIIAN